MQSSSFFSRITEVQEHMKLCSCGRGDAIMFSCEDSKCPNHLVQKFYCAACSDQVENPPHDHRGRTIASLIDALKTDWAGTR